MSKRGTILSRTKFKHCTLKTSEKKPAPIFSQMKSSNLVSADTAWRNAWHDDLGDALLSLLSHGVASSLFSSPAFSWRGRAAGYTLHVIVLLLRSGRLDDVEAGLVFVLSISAVIFRSVFPGPNPAHISNHLFSFPLKVASLIGAVEPPFVVIG